MRKTGTPPRNSAPDARGFTLVELLIVITIILVLIGLLFPVLGAARRAARKTTTEALVREVIAACDTFQVDNRRAPGYFTAQQMGALTNLPSGSGEPGMGRGFTTMENALIDLMGMPIQSADWVNVNAPDLANSFIEIGPFPQSNTGNIRLDLLALGSAAGPGYLSLKAENLFPVAGQRGTIDEMREDGSIKGMPDIVDSFGQPLLMWVRDPAAPAIGADMNSVNRFTRIDSSMERAHYYWAANSGYLTSTRLGDEPSNQGKFSAMGAPGDMIAQEEERLKTTVMGVLGSPAFPRERANATDPWYPISARGDIVVVSAGADRVFFKRKDDAADPMPPNDRVGYAPAGQTPAEIMGGPPLSVDEFDDIMQSTGG